MINIKSLLLALMLMLPLSAKENTTSATTVASSATLKSAYTLLNTMNMKKTYQGMLNRITDMQIQQNPQLANIKPTIHKFFEKYMGWDALVEDMAKVYAKNFTEMELNDITKFYKTKVGQKTIKLMPLLASAGAKIGQSKLASHLGELKVMIETELKKAKIEKDAKK